MKIGVFDSGVGGLSYAQAIKKALPAHEVILREDKENTPYGTKSPQLLLDLVTPIFQGMVDEGCQVIVVACNTVSTTIIRELREKFTIPLVAVEPMIKPAAELSTNKIIAVCATPTTLASSRYAELKAKYAKDVHVLEPDCSNWVPMIEHKKIDQQKIDQRINGVLNAQADVIVLACTHYNWIEEEIVALATGRAQVIQPMEAVIAQLKRVLEQLL